MTASNRSESCLRGESVMDAEKTTGGPMPDGSMRDVFCVPLIQRAVLNRYLENELIGKLILAESNAGPEKPTMPTSGNT